jgi:phosphoglycerol transferase MdoB-like AlkP superfamily enzyme
MIGNMIAVEGKMFQNIGGGLCVFSFYSLYLWQLFKSNPDNRVIECGSMTLVVFLALVHFCKPGKLPDWVFMHWLILTVLLCFTTLFFVVQRMYRALCRHKNT